jgi:hypothetical protein
MPGTSRLATIRPMIASPKKCYSGFTLSMHHPHEPRQYSRHAFRWLLIFAAMSATALWMMLNNWNLQDNPVASRIAITYLFIMCLGPYWMLYDSWHHERRLNRNMWFFFVPGGFIYYYFEVRRPRLRGGKLRSNKDQESDS